MANTFGFPFNRSNNYLGAYLLNPATRNALPVLQDMQFEVSAAQNAALSGATIPVTYSAVMGALSGSANGAITGATFAISYGLVSGGLSGSSIGSIGGASLAVSYSMLAGALAGQSTGNIAGATLSSVYNVVPGAIGGQINGVISGQAVAKIHSIVAGALQGAVNSNISGFIGQVVYSINSGALQDGNENVSTPSRRGDDAQDRARKVNYLKHLLEQPPPIKRKRKKRAIEILEIIDPLIKARSIPQVDVTSIQQAIEKFAALKLGYASLIATIQPVIERIKIDDTQDELEQQRQARRARHRKIAIAMLMAA